MNIMKCFAAALTLSMIGGAVASAHTKIVPQNFGASLTLGANPMPAKTSKLSHKGEVAPLGSTLSEPSKPLAFANFGQWGESGSEN